MEHYCESLYHNLQDDIAACKQEKLSCVEKVEHCFRLAVSAWMELSKKLRHHHFDSEESEIHFFKTQKPKITAEIEYYNFVYHSVLFQPEEANLIFHFWTREYERLERFAAVGHAFIKCYSEDWHERQSYFFLRKYYVAKKAVDVRIYDTDASLSANGDGLTATLLALKKYKEYCREKLESL
ncbi:MAG: RteC domain-containing protein [Flavisolibacter sp.]